MGKGEIGIPSRTRAALLSGTFFVPEDVRKNFSCGTVGDRPEEGSARTLAFARECQTVVSESGSVPEDLGMLLWLEEKETHEYRSGRTFFPGDNSWLYYRSRFQVVEKVGSFKVSLREQPQLSWAGPVQIYGSRKSVAAWDKNCDGTLGVGDSFALAVFDGAGKVLGNDHYLITDSGLTKMEERHKTGQPYVPADVDREDLIVGEPTALPAYKRDQITGPIQAAYQGTLRVVGLIR